MNRFWRWWVTAVTLFLLLGCNLTTAVIPSPFPTGTAAPPPTTAIVPLATSLATAVPLIPSPIPTATYTPAAAQTATAVPVPSRFTNVRFAAAPSGPAQTEFPVGTAEVFALWEFNGMAAGDVVQRVWRKDGATWLNREEIWAAGSSGGVTNISIFDRGLGGLDPGLYELDLLVNGVWQAVGQFTILPRPAAGSPVFANLRFAATPIGPPQSVFPAGTQRIFAVWDYQNMGVTDVVRREWRRDGEPWLIREETWDYLHYGPQGVVNDVSIYDFETGLPPGEYELLLFLNGIQQLAAALTITQ
ncbi:MAG: hypothetical protein IPM39_20665 [Chloroflexi bacterium]|nr:hypothetical protein [Chloroflexota bacterium]